MVAWNQNTEKKRNYITWIKTEDIYASIAKDIETRFDTSNYELKRPLLKGKNLKVIGLMKVELGGKIMAEFAALVPKTYSYLTNNIDENKKAKGTKKCVFNKIALSPNDDKIIQSMDSVETYACGTNDEIMHEKEEIKYTNTIKQYGKLLTITMLQKKTETYII